MVVRGHRVASGASGDPRFPGGTLAMQRPHFRERGLDFSGWPSATINISVAPLRYRVETPWRTFREVAWHPTEPAEDFSFFRCRVEGVEALVYHPHPDTKPEHEQPDDVLEILAREWIDGLGYGDGVVLHVDPAGLSFH